MPQRKSVRKLDAREIQGEGAWVKVSAVKVGEIRKIRKLREKEEGDSFERSLDLAAKHILSWNLVDDDGNPLPQPQKDPSVIDDLTEEEATWIILRLMSNEEQKN